MSSRKSDCHPAPPQAAHRRLHFKKPFHPTPPPLPIHLELLAPPDHLDSLELLRPPALPLRSTLLPHASASSSSSRDSRASRSSRHSRLPGPTALPLRSPPPPHAPASSSLSRASRASKSSRHSRLLGPPALPFRSTHPPHASASSSSSSASRASRSSRLSRASSISALTGTNAVFHTRPRQIKTIPPPQNNTSLNGRAQLEKVGRIIYAMLFLRHVAAPALKKSRPCKKIPLQKVAESEVLHVPISAPISADIVSMAFTYRRNIHVITPTPQA